MSAPILGITSFRYLNSLGHPVIAVNEAYVKAVSRSGALPVLIPLGLDEAALDQIFERLDGIVFTGGGDIHPEQYGSQLHPKVDEVDQDRDRVEIHLVKRACAARLPFLGICRGLQVVNIALGGTLYEDITDQRPGSLEHQYYPDWPRDYLAHTVSIAQGSRLNEIIGSGEIAVNSLHHQGIRALAPAAIATAHAPDGIIEAIEIKGHPYGLAVQWHPEWLPNDAAMQAIFADFARAAGMNEPAP